MRTQAGPSSANIKVDASLKRKYEKLASSIRDAKKRGASAFDTLWEAVGEVLEHEPPLYVVGGYRDAAEFFRKELGETRRNGFRFVRVAKFASPRDEEEYGTTKLDAALSYLEAKLGAPLAHAPLPVAFDRLRIPVKDGSRSLDEARVEDINAAIRALKKKDKAPTSSFERTAKAKLADHASLAEVGVRVRGGLMTLTNVPVAALDLLLKTLKSVRWDPKVEATRKKSPPKKSPPKKSPPKQRATKRTHRGS